MQANRNDTKWLIYHLISAQPDGQYGDPENTSGPQVVPMIQRSLQELGVSVSNMAISAHLQEFQRRRIVKTGINGRRRYFLAISGRVPKEYSTWYETRGQFITQIIEPEPEPIAEPEVLAEPLVDTPSAVAAIASESPLESLLEPLSMVVVKRFAEALLVGLEPPQTSASAETPESDAVIATRLSDALRHGTKLRKKLDEAHEIVSKLREENRSLSHRLESSRRTIATLESSVRTLSEERVVVDSGLGELQKLMQEKPKL